MLGFLKRLGLGRTTRQAADEQSKLTEAAQMGHDIADASTGAVDNFMEIRARPVALGLFEVFKSRIHKIDLDDPRFSPVDLARGEAQLFLEKTDEFKVKMREECLEATTEWADLLATMGMPDVHASYIDRRLADRYEMVAWCSSPPSLHPAGYKAELFPD